MALLTAACNKDDSDSSSSSGDPKKPTLAIPNSNTAARYDVAQDGGALDFVEFPANGTFIVGERSMGYVDVKDGKCTPQDNNTYLLEGWGTVAVKLTEAGDGYLLDVTPNGSSTVTVPVTLKKASMTDGESRKLCNRWDLKSIRLQMRILTNRFDREYTQDQQDQMQTEVVDFLKSSIPENIQSAMGVDFNDIIDINSLIQSDGFYTQYTLTTLGTLVVKGMNDNRKVGTWAWTDSKKAAISATLPYEETFEAKVSYRGEQLCIAPKIKVLEDMMGQFGSIAQLAFSWELDMYCDKKE